MLGSMNLSEYVVNNLECGPCFDHKAFIRDAKIAITALNDVLEEGMDLHPLQEQRECVSKWRQVGLGIMGLGDMLIKLGIRYGSPEACELCEQIGSEMINAALQQSALLARERGTFSEYDYEYIKKSKFFKTVANEETVKLVSEYGLRNSQVLTCAPTGSLSTMVGVSGGIEPLYANSYTRTTKSLYGKDVVYKVYPDIVKEYMDSHGVQEESDLPDYFVTAQTIPYEERINMQASFQGFIDASISSTINLPNSATIEDIENIYMLAWKKGLKGVTVFRDGCERAGILNTSSSKEDDRASADKTVAPSDARGYIKKVGNDAVGLERHLTTGCGSLHCSAFFDPYTGELLETYLSKGSQGGCLSSLTGLSRMISLAARGGISVDNIIDQLQSVVACPSYAVRRATKNDTSKGNCCPAAVGNALLDMYNEMQKAVKKADKVCTCNEESKNEAAEINAQNPCPQCGDELVFEGGCAVCKSCGYSRCG